MTEVQPPAFSVSWQVTPSGVVVTALGEIDLETAPSLDAAITEAAQHATDVALDLRGVTFLGSAGLGLLVSWNRRHGSFVVVAPQSAVLRVMTITGLDQALTIVKELSAQDTTA